MIAQRGIDKESPVLVEGIAMRFMDMSTNRHLGLNNLIYSVPQILTSYMAASHNLIAVAVRWCVSDKDVHWRNIIPDGRHIIQHESASQMNRCVWRNKHCQ